MFFLLPFFLINAFFGFHGKCLLNTFIKNVLGECFLIMLDDSQITSFKLVIKQVYNRKSENVNVFYYVPICIGSTIFLIKTIVESDVK